MADTFASNAVLADLHRRVSVMETTFFGTSAQVPDPMLLVSLYWDACRHEDFADDATARHWERQIFHLDARALLLMARKTRDPLPWHPMLVLLDRYISAGFDLETCRQHLTSVAQDLLNLQGFRKISPRDVMGNPLRVKSILAAISGRGVLHGTKLKVSAPTPLAR